MTDVSAPQPTLTALVVTYNRLEKLQRTLAHLCAQSQAHLQKIVVINNASTDGTTDWLSQLQDPRLDIRHLPKNIGGAGGFAAGIRHVTTEIDPDWLVVMDDDAWPDERCLTWFHGQDRTKADAWCAAVYQASGTISDMNRPLRNPFWSLPLFLRTLLRGRDAFHLGAADFTGSEQRNVDVGSFVGLFLSRDALARGGLPKADLFIYGDDTLYCLNLRRKGCALRFDPGLVFTHDCETLDDPDGVIRPFWKAYFYHRNLLAVYRAAAGPVFFPLVRLGMAWRWRQRAKAYGADAQVFRDVLDLALRDADAGRHAATRAEIAERFPGGAQR